MIRAPVGGQWRLVDLGVFAAAHEQVVDELRACGYVGDELDAAIAERLPQRLLEILDGPSRAVH